MNHNTEVEPSLEVAAGLMVSPPKIQVSNLISVLTSYMISCSSPKTTKEQEDGRSS